MKRFDVIIAGGGFSGMMAALRLSSRKKVLLVEKQSVLGRKLLVTGNGKCNLTNQKQNVSCYRGSDPKKAFAIVERHPPEELRGQLAALGILTKEKNGYVYPYNEQAAAIREVLEQEVRSRKNIVVSCDTEILSVSRKQEVFVIKTASGSMEKTSSGSAGQIPSGRNGRASSGSAGQIPSGKNGRTSSGSAGQIPSGRNGRASAASAERASFGSVCAPVFLCTTGGLAAGKAFGCEGAGYEIAEAFGHRIRTPFPALTALKSGAPFLKKVSGVRNQASILLFVDGQEVAREQGELQWTDSGVSGIAVFCLSRYAIDALLEKKDVRLLLHFMPGYSREAVWKLLRDLQESHPSRDAALVMKGILPGKLVPIVLREGGIAPETGFGGLAERQLSALTEALTAFPLKIRGYAGYEKAQVTAGGVLLADLDDTMQSGHCPGLCFAGEVTDVDGTCGGYNLQWAYSSAMAACDGIL